MNEPDILLREMVEPKFIDIPFRTLPFIYDFSPHVFQPFTLRKFPTLAAQIRNPLKEEKMKEEDLLLTIELMGKEIRLLRTQCGSLRTNSESLVRQKLEYEEIIKTGRAENDRLGSLNDNLRKELDAATCHSASLVRELKVANERISYFSSLLKKRRNKPKKD